MVVMAVLSVAAVVLNLYWMYADKSSRVGNGRDLDTYGFDVSNLAVPRESLVAIRHKHKDAKPVIFDAGHITVDELAARNARFGSYIRYMVDNDPVVGVSINGEARAYPVRFIRFHEIVNDTLGGVPIAVTFSPMSDAAVVFDRRVDGETLTFGYSGLLHNSNLVMYDQQPNAEPAAGADQVARAVADGAGESLWVQLMFEAVSGPLQGTKLTQLPMWYGPWAEWFETYPDTTVLDRVSEHAQWYKQDPYAEQFKSGVPMFPVEPYPPSDHPSGLKAMDRVLVIRQADGTREVVPERDVAGRALGADSAEIARAAWFAWYAIHGDTGLVHDAAKR